MLLKITLKCLSLKVIFDLLFHHRIWYTGDVEINNFVINLKVELIHVITMFERTNFLHFVRASFHKFPRSIVIFQDAFSSSFTGSPVRSEELSSPCDLPTISWVTGSPVRSSMGLGYWVGLEEPK